MMGSQSAAISVLHILWLYKAETKPHLWKQLVTAVSHKWRGKKKE